MSVLNSSLLLGQEGGGYTISRSLRFNSADSAYLSRTPSSNGNRKTFTFSAWVKLCNTNNTQNFLNAGDNSTRGRSIFRYSSQKFGLIASAVGGTTAADVTTDAVFQDFAAWYHMTWAIDTTEATGTNRVKLWVNGASQQLTFTTTPDLDGLFTINHASAHRIGGAVYTSGQFPDFYLADIHLIDGQALDHTSFGEFDATTGAWSPKAYTGSYGTNGFRLNFADNSDTTATTLGKDAAGSNNWTPNNFSVTAGAGNDSFVDVPTSNGTDTGTGGELRGNYCTWNPVCAGAAGLSNGNLNASLSGSGAYNAFGTISVTSGKWYWEVTLTSGATSAYLGIMDSTMSVATSNTWSSEARAYRDNGQKYDGALATYGATYTTGDTIGVALDLDAGTLVFYKNGVSQGTAFSSGLTGKEWKPFAYGNTTVAYAANFGQRPFAYTAPSGFKALCTTSLPAPTVVKPNTAMDVVTYTGTGSTLTPTSSLGFGPDLIWIKSRSAATDHTLYDIVRGAQARLESNNADAEVTSDSGVTAFNSNGFTLGTLAQVNTNNATYTGWCWDAGSSTVTNTQGSITSNVRANASAGFSVITYTGNGSLGATIGHGLGVAPHFFLMKHRGPGSVGWAVYHKSLTASSYLQLESTNGSASTSALWNNTEPTSTLITLGNSSFSNANTANYVAYCWTPVAGYSAFGSYAGNGVADGPFVYTGFRPSFVLIKMSTSAASWRLYDSRRPGRNVIGGVLYPDSTSAETTGAEIDFLANGFKFRDWGGGINNSSQTHVYAAFAEAPFQYARAR